MGRIISPWVDADFAVGGRFEPIAANFPEFKHLYKFEEITGDTVYVDSIGGSNIDAGGEITRSADGFGVVSTAPGTGLALAAGASPVTIPGTSPFVYFDIALWNSTASYGTAGGGGITLAQAAPKVGDGTNQLTLNAFTASTVVAYGRMVALDFAANATPIECSTAAATGSIKAGTAIGLLSTGIPAIADSFSLPSGSSFYMRGIMKFSATLPPLQVLLNSLAWMTAEAAAGRKRICPLLAGLA